MKGRRRKLPDTFKNNPLDPHRDEQMSKEDAEKQRRKEQIEAQLRRNKEIREQWINADKR